MSNLNTEELVSAYVTLRDERAKLKEAYETEDKKLNEDMNKIEQTMLSICNEIGADSIKTSAGTVIRKLLS